MEVKLVEKQPDGSYLVDAAMDTVDFAATFGFKLPDGDYETLGGFLNSMAGSIPDVNEKFAFNGWQFIVHSKEGPRLGRVKLLRPKGAPAAKDKELKATDIPQLPRASRGPVA